MARNIHVELLSDSVRALTVQPDMTVEELKEEVKAFHPSEDEMTRMLSTVDLLLDGKKLRDPGMMVSECIFESAKVQVLFYVQPAPVCTSNRSHIWKTLRDVQIPSTETIIQQYAFKGSHALLRLVIPESVTEIRLEAFAGCSSLKSQTLQGAAASKSL